MRTLIAALVVLISAAAPGSGLDYSSARRWIEMQCSTNTAISEQRLYIGRRHSPVYADIVQFRNGITIREIIDRSPLRGKTAQVCVMWPHTIAKTGSSFTRHKYITVRPSDAPAYELKNSDVIWLYDEGPIIVR